VCKRGRTNLFHSQGNRGGNQQRMHSAGTREKTPGDHGETERQNMLNKKMRGGILAIDHIGACTVRVKRNTPLPSTLMDVSRSGGRHRRLFGSRAEEHTLTEK